VTTVPDGSTPRPTHPIAYIFTTSPLHALMHSSAFVSHTSNSGFRILHHQTYEIQRYILLIWPSQRCAGSRGAFLDNICHNREASFLKAMLNQQPYQTKPHEKWSSYMAIYPQWNDWMLDNLLLSCVNTQQEKTAPKRFSTVVL